MRKRKQVDFSINYLYAFGFLLIIAFAILLAGIICTENFENSLVNKCTLMSIAPSQTTGSRMNTRMNPRMNIPKNTKYILFQIDCGGLNNIKMQYEVLTVLAWITGRTLVLHPKTKWYLLGDKKISIGDVFDINCWASQIPLLNAEEFMIRKGFNPSSLSDNDNTIDYHKFFKSLEKGKFGKVYEPSWSPGRTAFNAKEIKDAEDHDMWYFYCDRMENFRNLDHRMFGNMECYYRTLPSNKRKQIRKLVWNAIRFREEFYKDAQRDLDKLGLRAGEYNAVHVRNWEGSQPQYKLRSQEEIIDKILSLDKNIPILLLSQDVVKNVPERIREKVNRLFNNYKLVRPPKTGSRLQQSIREMLLAVPAKKFYGSPSSTYSTGIMQLRGDFSRFCNVIDSEPKFLDGKEYDSCGSGWNFGKAIKSRWTEFYKNA